MIANAFNSSCKTTFVLFCLLFIVNPLYAIVLEEVVVTAQKREESVKEVPITMDVMNGKTMSQLGVKDTDDIQALYPNLSTHNTSQANTGFTIRGVGTDNIHISGQQSVTTYIDDVALPSPFISSIGVFDVERVEILRGPQNTLYGRNTIGGAVIFNSVKPVAGENANGKLSLGMGQGGEKDAEFAVGLPVGEDWALRFAGKSSELEGYLTNVLDGEKVGGYDRMGFRAMLQGNFSDRASMLLSVYGGDGDGDSSVNVQTGNFDSAGNSCSHNYDVDQILNNQSCVYQRVIKASELQVNTVLGQLQAREPGRFLTVVSNTYVNLWTPEGDVYYHPDNGYTSDYDGANLYFNYDFDSVALNTITSKSETYFQGNNYRTLHGFSFHQEGEWDSFTQEIRLSSITDDPVRWLAGFYYNTEDSLQDTWVTNAAPPPGLVVPAIIIDSEYENKSAYFQLDYDINEKFSLSGGLRYTSDILEGDWARYVVVMRPSVDGADELNRDYFIETDPNGPEADVPNPTQELDETGWKLGVKYNLDIGMLYAHASTGFKGGAYDNRALSFGTNPIGPEFLDALEAGIKTSFIEDQLQVDAAIFNYKWEDQQLFDINPDSGAPSVLNIGETSLNGIELNARWAPSERFYLQAGLGVLDGEITEPGAEAIAENSAASVGDEIPNVPSRSMNLLAVYTMPLGNGYLDIQGTYRYVGNYYHNFDQDIANTEVKAHDWLGANIIYSFGEDQKYDIGLYGKNLTGEYYCAEFVTGLPSGNNWTCRIQDNSYGEATYGVIFNGRF